LSVVERGGKLGAKTNDGDHMSGVQDPSTDTEVVSELTANFSETVGALFSAGSVRDTLEQVVGLAVATVEGCDYAGLFLLENGELTTPVRSDQVAADVDALQQALADGPCMAAVADGVGSYTGDLADDARWPVFGPRAVELGIRSVLAVPLPVENVPGCLNLYAHYPHAFGVIDRGRAVLLATVAAMALTSARSHEDDELRETNLHAALATRELIGQAQGILMEREHIGPGPAFDILRRASQHLNIKLRDVARNLIETGERPDTGGR
jgi:GAF domain-containing protein